MSSRIDDTLRFNQTALTLRAARQELIASNIANADTPNYKAKDIDFSKAMQGALAGSNAKLQMATTAVSHLNGGGSDALGALGAPVMYRSAVQPSADGNTVDMDVERAQFADNALHYEASVHFISDDIKKILTALQG